MNSWQINEIFGNQNFCRIWTLMLVVIRQFSFAFGIWECEITFFIKSHSNFLKLHLTCFKCRLWTWWSDLIPRLSLLFSVSKSYGENIPEVTQGLRSLAADYESNSIPFKNLLYVLPKNSTTLLKFDFLSIQHLILGRL